MLFSAGPLWNTVRPTSSRLWRAMVFLCALALAGAAQAQPAHSPAEIQQRAESGDIEAQNAYGNLLTQARRFPEAIEWYRKAADKGHAPAQFNLGLAHELGRGVAADERAAFRHYLLAAERGLTNAQFNVGNMYAAGRGVGQDLFEASVWFKQAAEAGLAEAQYNLGVAYEAGRGVRKDESQAARWYKAAADQGFPRAQYNLGLLLEDGRGVAKDEAAAAALYTAAAERGFPAAQNNLGLMYATGRGGLAKDLNTAYAWLTLAVEGGASPQGRDFVAGNLGPDALAPARAAAAQLRERLQRGAAAPSRAAPSLGAPANPPPTTGGDDRAARQELERAVAANNRLAEVNQRLTAEKAQLELDKANVEKWAGSLEKTLNERSTVAAQAEVLRADLAAAQQRLQQSEADVGRLTAELATARNQAPGSAADEIRHLQDEVARLRRLAGEASGLRAINDRLMSELDRLRKGTTTPAEIDALRTQLAGVKSSEEKARQDLAETQKSLAAARTTAEQRETALAAAQKELAEARATAQGAAAEADEAAKLREKVRQLTDENARLAAAPRRDDAPLLAARQQADDLQARLTAAESDRDSIRQDALQLRDEFRKTRDTLAAAEARIDELHREAGRQQQAATQSASASAELVAARQEAGKLRADLDAASQALRARGEEIAALRDQQARAAGTRDESDAALRGQLAAAREEARTARENSDRLASDLAAAQQAARERDTRIAALERDLSAARSTPAEPVAELRRKLAEATRTAETRQTNVAELTAANDRLAREIAAARQDAAQLAPLRAQVQELLQENNRLNSRPRDNRDAKALENARAQIVELENQLAEARAAAAKPAAPDTVAEKLRADLVEATQANDKLRMQVAELTAANGKLEQDFTNARKTAEAALAAQAQAVAANQGDAFRTEINTLQARVKELDAQIEEERNNTAKEIAALAAQLTRARETNKSLAEANRALLSAKQADDAPSRAEFEQAQARLRDMVAAGDELRRQIQQLGDANEKLTAERDAFRQQLADAEKEAGQHGSSVAELTGTNEKLAQERDALGQRVDALTAQLAAAQKSGSSASEKLEQEKNALQERLEAVGGQLVRAQAEVDSLQKELAEVQAKALADRQRADNAGADLAALQARAAETEKAAENQTASVTELTGANAKLEAQVKDLQQQLAAQRTETARLGQLARSADVSRADAERNATANINAMAGQLVEVRRDLEGLRAANARLVEANTALERERATTMVQLREENRSLAARLAQAQGTLDQIAAAARLGTPAAQIASGTVPAARPAAPAAEARFHTVVEGDSLSRISLRYYGTANRWQEIYNANRDVLQGSSALRVGMQLRIP
ncbi:MAG: hypothetical protein C0502_08000 [Opitutus sp.]|nr:hypothetical protein [Opitutus sp.]